MNDHALQALEFDRIRELLVVRAASLPGRERLHTAGPFDSIERAHDALALLRQVVALRLEEPSWPEIPVPDLRSWISQARTPGSVLEAEALQEVGRALQLAKRIRGVFAPSARRETYPRLAEIADRIAADTGFAARVERTFDPSGEVRDEASSALRSIRTRLRRRQQEVSQRLSGLSRSFRESGEDSFVTLRGGRYVLSVAAAEQRRLKGIVHDRSATGKTIYLEPLDIVEVNNSLAELEADERVEVFRVLSELTAWVREHGGELIETQEALAALDELNARARLCEQLDATVPCLDAAAGTLRLVKARHPLLHLAAGKEVIPLNLDLNETSRGLVISGPNMGGKTVVLKTVGLAVAMAMAGLFVPAAEGAVIPWVDEVFVDIGDEQSLDFDLSTYAGHLRNMEAILSRSSKRSLVLIDELGAGTDPDEGAALGISLLREIGERGSLCIATTHLGAFKTFAADAGGFKNAAMEHDPETLAPTYTLHVGLPGRSHAFELARREGWPVEFLDEARSLLSEERVQTESLLAQIQAERTALGAERERTEADRERLSASRERFEKLTAELQEKVDAVELEKAIAQDRTFAELRRLMRDMKARLALLEKREKEIESQAAKAAEAARSGPVRPVGEIRRWVHARERETAQLRKERSLPTRRARSGGVGRTPLLAEDIVAGRTAFARSLGLEVVIQGGDPDGDRIWVEHQGRRIKVRRGDLEAPPPGSGEAPASSPPEPLPVRLPEESSELVSEALRGELDLRGLDQEACQDRLERFLDRALMAGVTRVRIIHGKGTGALRRRVQEVLGHHPLVQSQREGESGEGGWGVTIAFLDNGGKKGAPSRGPHA